MSIFFSCVYLIVVSVFLSIIAEKKTEEIVFTLSLSTIIVLFLFYCKNMLFAGRVTVYVLLLLLLVFSIITGVRKSALSVKKILSSISPSLIVFAILGVVAFLYTRGHRVSMWDELRLWGAVPKALYRTQALQLGTSADIFPIMQSYPPAMPLFVYFFIAPSPSFNEGYIFCLYTMFYALIFLPGLKKLEWKHWYWILPLVISIFFFPCIFTSHDLNYSRFYNSLYIDAILGFYAGYGFYLSLNDPFKDKYELVNFCLVLAVTVLLKDSGIMLSITILICAVLISAFHKRPFDSKTTFSLSCCILASGLPYFIWKHTISAYGIVNHLSVNYTLPSVDYFGELVRHFLHDYIICFSFRSLPTIIVSFIPCILFAIIADVLIFKYYKDTDTLSDVIVVASMAVSSLIFIIGYCMVFPDGSFPSFQRYMSTILYLIFTYLLLRFINAVIMNSGEKQISLNRRSVAAFILSGASAVSLVALIPFFSDWRDSRVDNRYWPTLYSESSIHTANILDAEGNNSTEDKNNIYLLLADGNSLLHHRIYFDLIGEPVNVKNFYFHCQGVPINTEIPVDDNEKLKEIVANWTDYLKENEIDYIYITSADEGTSAIFSQIRNSPVAKAETLYQIEFDGNELLLFPVQ